MRPIPANKAIDLYQALISVRRLQLQPALSEAVRVIGVAPIDEELNALVPADALTYVGQLGLRGELVFPTPVVIEHSPPLIGYYRMLLGMSKKEFRGPLGYMSWVTAEEDARISPRLRDELKNFCLRMIEPLSELVYAMGVFTSRDLSDLALLTLGPTLQGRRNTVIGQDAARYVFQATRNILDPTWISYEREESAIRFETPNGVTFELLAGSDPDLCINRGVGTANSPVVAIEIKGGGDVSNVHNRAGEAEKSQLKAAFEGYAERWTVINTSGVSKTRLASETPSSTDLFEYTEVAAQSGSDWQRFTERLLTLLGVS